MVGIGSLAAAARSLSEISPPASAMISSSSKTRSTDWTVPERASATESCDISPLSATAHMTADPFHHTEVDIHKARGKARRRGLTSGGLPGYSFRISTENFHIVKLRGAR